MSQFTSSEMLSVFLRIVLTHTFLEAVASVVSLPFNHIASLAIHGYDSVSVTEKVRKKKSEYGLWKRQVINSSV